MLASIAHVFGWSEQDWKNRSDFRSDDEWKKKRSDFAWACGDAGWGPARQTAQVLLGGSASGPSPDSSTQAADNLFASARQQRPLSKHFAGNVSFVSAHPVNLSKVDGLLMVVPPLGQLELDVVTCHHGEYYASKDPNKKATDTEEPVPVVFPAIAPGHVFAFALLPLRDCATELLKHARTWLATGLSTLGLGAKTAAGYGWFDTSQSTHQEIVKSLEKLKLDRKLAEAKAKKDAADKAEQEEIARRTRILGPQAVQAHRSRGSIIKLANLNR